MTDLPLSDVRVCDITQNMAGPISTRLLAELGADVIHVEPIGGEGSRRITTEFTGGEGVIFQNVNRSKRGIALDLKSAPGKEIIDRLLGQCDVLVENLGPGVMDRLGLGYQAVSARYPRLIYGSISAYGEAGVKAGLKGYDFLLQGLAGLTAPKGDGQREFVVRGPIGDTSSPMLLTIGILAALLERVGTSAGRHVQSSLLHGVLHMIGPRLLQVDDDPYLSTTAEVPIGAEDPSTGAFLASDQKWIAIVASTDRQFRALCEVLGRADLRDDPDLATTMQRLARSAEVRSALGEAIAQRAAADWITLLRVADVPCEFVFELPKEILHANAVWSDEAFCTYEHPTLGRIVQPRTGIRWGDTPLSPKHAAPVLGQDTEQVLTELGYTTQEISELIKSGRVVASAIGRG